MSDKKPLNPRQAKFVEYYIDNGNGTLSAKLAGYSEKTAKSTATRMLSFAHIKQAVAERQAQLQNVLQKRTEITKEQLIDRLIHFAFGDLSDVASWGNDGTFIKSSDDLDKAKLATVKKIISTEFKRFDKSGNEIGSTVRTIIEQKDQLRAIELLAKLLGYMTEKHEHTGKDGKPIEVQPQIDHKALRAEIMKLMDRPGRKFE